MRVETRGPAQWELEPQRATQGTKEREKHPGFSLSLPRQSPASISDWWTQSAATWPQGPGQRKREEWIWGKTDYGHDSTLGARIKCVLLLYAPETVGLGDSKSWLTDTATDNVKQVNKQTGKSNKWRIKCETIIIFNHNFEENISTLNLWAWGSGQGARSPAMPGSWRRSTFENLSRGAQDPQLKAESSPRH